MRRDAPASLGEDYGHVHLTAPGTGLARAAMPCEDQLAHVRRPVGCVAREHGRWRELELELEPGPEPEPEPGEREPELERVREHGCEHGRVLSAATGSCSLVVAVAVQLEVMWIPYEVDDHMRLSSRVEVVGVHRHVDEAEADDVVGHNEDVHWHLPGGDMKDPGHIEPRRSVVWLEGWAAKHRQAGMAVYE